MTKRIILAFVLAISVSPVFASKVATTQPKKGEIEHIKPGTEVKMGGLDILVEPPEIRKPKNAAVKVRINVPQVKGAVDVLTAYPYPIRPPAVKTRQEPLPCDPRGIKQYLMQYAYLDRRSHELAYPKFGFRWKYAIEAAMKRAGEGVPHSIFTVYPWINKMVPYVAPQCERINAEEKARSWRYSKCLEDYQQKHSELESETARQGIDPVTITIDKTGEGQVELQSGSWWISGTRKVPGLTYYWQQPVQIASGETAALLLNEGNALLIAGGW